ncbi:S26 family signal peptidase [Sphingobium sp. B2]|uniref:S26 family signal peptidase n=1 Tax=Sphingobium sp. B2 TaxID=2583228 RepID=UPI0011A4068E|nr:S26 family signal peptidase [Sphingobium sp. B2]
MNRRSILAVTGLATVLWLAGFAAIMAFDPKPRLLWNASASVPIGLYRLHSARKPATGDLVAILPPPQLARFMAERHYLPVGVPMLKRVAAGPGATICRFGPDVTVGGRLVAAAHDADRYGRPLPVWRGCRDVGVQELFLLNSAPDSFDGRYYGPIPASGLLGSAQPLLTRDTPAAPLRRRLGCAKLPDSKHASGDKPCR